MIGRKSYQELVAVLRRLAAQPRENEYRPCYVNGRKALFHRWVNTANPALPKGVDPNEEKAKFFQHRSTTGLVEYEDGTLARVWPQEIRFADGGYFSEYEWIPIEKMEEGNVSSRT